MKYIMVSFSDYCNSAFIDRVPYKQKLAASWEPGCVKCSKTFCKIFARQNMPNQTNAKHSSNSEDIFKSTKNDLEKLSLCPLFFFFFFTPNDSPLKTMTNVFYFI